MSDLLDAVRRAAGDSYTVYGELGRESDDDVWYLARDHRTEQLVAMRLYAERIRPDGLREYALEVARELNASVSVGLGECPKCAMPVRRWGRFCTRCGANLADSGPGTPADREALLARVRREAGQDYEVLGEMPWSGGGQVFFAVERRSRRLVRLRLRTEAGQDSLHETRALMPLGRGVQAAYLTAAMPARPSRSVPATEPSPPPSPPPPPPPSSPGVDPRRAGAASFGSPSIPSGVPRTESFPPPDRAEPAAVAGPGPMSGQPPPVASGVPIDAARAGWGAPFSAREWLLLAIIAGLGIAVVVLLLGG